MGRLHKDRTNERALTHGSDGRRFNTTVCKLASVKELFDANKKGDATVKARSKASYQVRASQHRIAKKFGFVRRSYTERTTD